MYDSFANALSLRYEATQDRWSIQISINLGRLDLTAHPSYYKMMHWLDALSTLYMYL